VNNQYNKQIDIEDMSCQLDHILQKIQNLNSQLQRIESQNTKARDGLKNYHDGYRTCARDEYKNSRAYD